MAGRESLPCFLLCLLVVTMCMGGEARQEDRSRYVDQGALYLITNFGFKDGGTAQMNITVENGGHAFILACTTDGWREFSQSSIYGVNCNSGEEFPGCFYTEMNGPSASLAFEVSIDSGHHEYYYFGFLSCQTFGQGEISFLLENPNGQQLSWGYIPMPGAYIVCMLAWLPVTCLWVYNWATHPHFKNKLHRLITLFAVAKILWCACSIGFWLHAASDPYLSNWVLFFYFTVWIVSVSLILVTLMLVGRGWQMFDEPVGNFKYTMIALVAMLVACEALSLVWGGFVKFLLLVCYGFVMIVIVSSVQDSIKKLQRRTGERATLLGENLYGQNVTQKRIRMFKRFNVIIIFFCVAQIAVAAATALRLHSEAWLSRSLLELLDVAVFIFIGYIFWIRSENVFYRLQGVGGAGKPERAAHGSPAVTWAEVESDEEEVPGEFEMQNMGELPQMGPGMAA